ncbi:MAG TPA: hypothetical protein VHE59_21120 [Mucilaginibacter sp.]|nr:hypothetical protein [Mucilaginibacter sp.]
MATTGTPKFSLANEIEKVRKYLLLPITYIEFDERCEYGKVCLDDNMDWIWMNAKLYVNDEPIGTIPYFSSEWGFGYDTSNHSVLAWDKIYQQFQQVLFDQILQREPRAVTAEPAEYEPHEYMTLNIKDKAGVLINKAGCLFIDGEWNVNVYGLNSTKKRYR